MAIGHTVRPHLVVEMGPYVFPGQSGQLTLWEDPNARILASYTCQPLACRTYVDADIYSQPIPSPSLSRCLP